LLLVNLHRHHFRTIVVYGDFIDGELLARAEKVIKYQWLMARNVISHLTKDIFVPLRGTTHCACQDITVMSWRYVCIFSQLLPPEDFRGTAIAQDILWA
jgi:hypothetical protein